jgi:glycosyltransferase involved in cell wall biosynthesis
MKIALDYREAAESRRAGKGEYVYQLTKALSAVPNVKIILVVGPGQTVDLASPNCRVYRAPVSGALWHLWVVAWLAITKPADIFFATVSVIVPALALRVPVATTLFDFTPWRFPATHNRWATWIERMFMGLALARSKWLLAISEFTKNEAVELFGVYPDRITVTPLAVDHSIFSPGEVSVDMANKLRSKYNLPEKFILYLGTIEPRKNISAIIKSFNNIKASHPGLHLVLAGNRGWYADKILEGAGKDIIVTGYIEDADRANLYRLAQVFVFPSLYEGFGLPPLEAVAVGVPTVISNRASLPEIGGSVAARVELEKPGQLDAAIKNFLSMSQSARSQLARQSTVWAKEFSWADTARKTLTALGYDR